MVSTVVVQPALPRTSLAEGSSSYLPVCFWVLTLAHVFQVVLISPDVLNFHRGFAFYPVITLQYAY